MNRVLISLTARQLLGRRRTALVGLVLGLPILIALIFRFSEDSSRDITSAEFALGIVSRLIMTLLLPLVALVLGTAALGAEIEDGTAVFLLAKPIERWRIIAIKIGVSALTTVVLVVPATIATAWIIHESPTADGLVLGLALGAMMASIMYCAVFVALSAVTSKALVIGLVYVFVWEGVVTSLFEGVRWISIREYASAWSSISISISDTHIYDPRLGVAAGIIASVVTVIGAQWYGSAALAKFEIGEQA